MYKPVVACFYACFPPRCILSLTVRVTLALIIYLFYLFIYLFQVIYLFALLRARPPSYPAAAGLRDRTPAAPAHMPADIAC